MPIKLERSVPTVERLDSVKPPDLPDWETVRVFLHVVRCGSFRAAAEDWKCVPNAVRRPVIELESRLGLALISKGRDGIALTPDGERIYEVAKRMEVEAFALLRARQVLDNRISGEVRIGITEGLGTYWLLPKLVDFQRRNPLLVVDLRCAMQSADVMRFEAELAVQLERPTSPELIVTKLGTMHTMPFAAPRYLQTYGAPTNLEELKRGKIVLQEAEQLTTQAEYERIFPNTPQSGFVAMKNNVGSAHFWAIIRGAGIGMLPTYAAAIGCNVIPLDLPIRRKYEIWLTYHPDLKNLDRVRTTLDWIIDSFDPEVYPWFRDEFIHPNQFDPNIGREYLADVLQEQFKIDEGIRG